VAIRARGDLKAGPECQVRHLATLDAVERGVETECARQAALRDAGAPVEPGVRLWDDAAGAAAAARAPEPPVWELVDPDLSGLVLTAEWIAERRAALPELGPARRERLRRDHALPPATLAAVAGDLPFAEYVESVVRLHGDGTRAGQWIEAHLLPYMARESLGVRDVARRVRPSDLAQLLDLLRDGRLSDDAAERVYRRMLRAGVGVKDAAEREGFVIVDADA
jgi:aspartyl-tRNA(Asn)/glutamyl-tRNA(Gln) amidotransferase subunit B